MAQVYLVNVQLYLEKCCFVDTTVFCWFTAAEKALWSLTETLCGAALPRQPTSIVNTDLAFKEMRGSFTNPSTCVLHFTCYMTAHLVQCVYFSEWTVVPHWLYLHCCPSILKLRVWLPGGPDNSAVFPAAKPPHRDLSADSNWAAVASRAGFL